MASHGSRRGLTVIEVIVIVYLVVYGVELHWILLSLILVLALMFVLDDSLIQATTVATLLLIEDSIPIIGLVSLMIKDEITLTLFIGVHFFIIVEARII